jgi:hypothetical protein
VIKSIFVQKSSEIDQGLEIAISKRLCQESKKVNQLALQIAVQGQ